MKNKGFTVFLYSILVFFLLSLTVCGIASAAAPAKAHKR